MPHADGCESLSFGDALFLHLERPGMPLHVAALAVFDGEIALQDCMRHIESRLPLVPRYRQRVAPPPFNLGLPAWQDDPGFDICNHVRQHRLKRGTEAEMRAVASRILSGTMRRDRPLWEFTLLPGLKGNRTGLLIRLHHCLADGLAGVALINVLLDGASAPPALSPETPTRPERRSPAPPPSIVECLVDSCFSAVERVLTAQSQLLTMAQRVLAAEHSPAGATPAGLGTATALPSLDEFNRLLPELFSPAERLPFNVVCRGPQKFSWTGIPLADMKAVKRAAASTFNDVVLTVIAAAIRRYLQARGDSPRRRSLRVVVPVSMRNGHDSGRLGNQISFIPVSIPLNIASPRRLLTAIHQQTMLLKATHLAEVVGFAGTLLGVVPCPLQATLGPIASQLPLSVCNLICTDVPGPRDALYLLGHKMLACYPYVPIGGEMGMNIAVLTYNGVAHFGFTGDVHAIPDLHRMPALLQEAFQELQRQSGIKKVVVRPARKRPAAPQPVIAFPEVKEVVPAAEPRVRRAAAGD